MRFQLRFAIVLCATFLGSTVAARQAEAISDLHSPRATMRSFLTLNHDQNYAEAAACLDWSGTSYSGNEKDELVRQLKAIIDRMAYVDYRHIPDTAKGDPYRFPPAAEVQPIVIGLTAEGSWLFTTETVARISAMYDVWKDKPRIIAEIPPWYLRTTPFGIEIWRIAVLFLSILISWIAGRILRYLLNSGASTLENRQRQYGAAVLKALSRAAVPLCLVLGLKTGLSFLLMVPVVELAANTIVAILFTMVTGYAVWCLVDLVDVWLSSFATKTDSKLDDMLAPMIRTSLRVTIVILVLVQIATILSNKPMTSVIAGLGVGGLAIGLAAQDTIKNFFGSIMIFSDRPFELGDRIQVSGYDGTVETVGFRSTRVRTLDGHLVTFPNGELANQSIRNVAKRPNIRRILDIGITYDTPPAKVQQALNIVQEVLKDHEGQDPDMPARVFFNEFKDSSLNISAIYWYHPADWWAYCEFTQWANMEILKRFNAAGIEFAFPSQTIYMASPEKG